jgi:hypothetical protein
VRTLDPKLFERIPVVHDELQMHAIGCYSVCGGLKRELRQSELAAADAENLLRRNTPEAEHRRELDEAWQTIENTRKPRKGRKGFPRR